MASSLSWHHHHPVLPSLSSSSRSKHLFINRQSPPNNIQCFRRSDFDGFAKRVTSGDTWRQAWRSANDGFEQLLYDATKAAERLDRRYSVSRRISSLADTAAYRARELDRDLQIGTRWRSFTLDFSRNSPRYRKQLSDFLNSPLGRSFATIFFLWFALSGWMFRFLIFATFVLPIAAPLLIGTVANNFVIQGACPACKKQFMGYKNQVVRCTSCGNTVWQPKDNNSNNDFFSRGRKDSSSSSRSNADIIDVEFEEK